MHVRYTVLPLVSMLFVVAATGCGATVSATPSTIGSTNNSPAGSAQPTVPADFPVMPGAMRADGPSSDRDLIATWTTDADGAQVYEFYVSALPTAGFVIVGLYPGGSAAIIRFRRPDGAVLQLAITAARSGVATEVQLRLDAP